MKEYKFIIPDTTKDHNELYSGGIDWEQRQWDATVAAMQGLCSSFINDETYRDEHNYAAIAVMIAKATIAEFKKQKP